jgi:hypothetical protein
VLAIWSYGQLRTNDPDIDLMVQRYYELTVGPYWPPERHIVDNGLRSIEFPFEEFVAPPFVLEAELTLDQLAGYIRTWSATRRYVDAEGIDPVPDLVRLIQPAWGEPARARRVTWPLAFRAGRRSAR